MSELPTDPKTNSELLRLQFMLDASQDCIKVLDLDARLLSMNAGGLRVMEIDDFQSCQFVLWPEFWEGDARRQVELGLEAARAGRTFTFEGQAKTFAGTPRWWDVQISPLRDETGAVTQVLAVSRDITARKSAEQQLQDYTSGLESQASRNERALEAFVRFTTAVSSSTDLEVLATTAADTVRDVVGDAMSGFYLVDGATAFPLVFSSNTPPAVMAARRTVGVPLEAPLVAEALKRRGVAFADHDLGRQQSVGYASALSVTPYWLHDQPYALFATGTARLAWTAQEQAIIESVGQGLGLALERAHQAQELREERAGLDAFVAFTEAVGTETDVFSLATQAVKVLSQRFTDCTAGYYVLEDDLWKLRIHTDDLYNNPGLLQLARSGLPKETPVFLQAFQSQAVVFIDGWDPQRDQIERTEAYGTIAASPAIQIGNVCAVLAVGLKSETRWSERDQAIFRAVGRGLNLALERADAMQEVQAQQAVVESRNRALEAFAQLARDMVNETDRYALVERAQEVVMSLLTPGYTLYWEPEGERWRLKSQVGDTCHPELQRLVNEQGLPLDTPTLHPTWITGKPLYQDQYAQGTDTPAEMIRHVNAAASFRLSVNGAPVGMLAIGLFDQRVWSPADRAVLETTMFSLGLALERAQSVAELAERSRELEQTNHDLQAANEELGAFTYSASHDLRTPLRHVMGFAELAQKALTTSPNEKAQQYLEVVKQGAQRMNDLIDGMLVLAQSGRQELNSRWIDLNELVSQARRDVGAEFGGHPVRWQMTNLPRVHGDRSMLQQVMTNLLSNAVKYSAKRELSEVKVWGEESTSEWTIHVQDNGVGFNPEYAQKLFGTFQRLHPERDFKGIGIGLATVKRIVLKHGGQVFAESQPDHGATFSFTLPKRNLS